MLCGCEKVGRFYTYIREKVLFMHLRVTQIFILPGYAFCIM